MLGIALQKHGFQTHHAEADAVVLIVQTAIDCSSVSDTILMVDLFYSVFPGLMVKHMLKYVNHM